MNDDITMQVKMQSKCFADIEKLAKGEHINEAQIIEKLDFINSRYDCADFRMICILRTAYDYLSLISEETAQKIKECILGFKYWMDEPGEDSMCYWSENHQLLFAVCEYLAGQKYPSETFRNSGISGTKHMEKAAVKINWWLKRRFELGFIEWHSNTYYEEDIAPLSLLIDFCNDNAIVKRSVMLMDLLMLDLALHSFNGAFCATSGRCYEMQKKQPSSQDVLDIIEKAFDLGRIKNYDYTRLSADFILNKSYKLPPVIRAIAHCTEPQEICDSMGLNLSEVKSYFGKNADIEDKGGFMWAMEAFTNVESVNTTIELFNKYKLYSNIFLKDLKMINIAPLKVLGLLPTLVKILNPITQGVAIQRADTYTYKTKSWMLSTVQGYHPQEFGDQQHIWQATLCGDITVFTTHPGAAFFEDNARNFSPGKWVGNGINPYSAQHGNVSLSLYNLKVRKGFMESERARYTHAWLPFSAFDEVHFKSGEKLLTARKEDAYIALIGTQPLESGEENEIIQRGDVTGWICITGSKAKSGSFENFINEVSRCHITATDKMLSIKLDSAEGFIKLSSKDELSIRLKDGFYINSVKQNTSYPRLKTPYGIVKRNPDCYKIEHDGHKIILDYDKCIREVI